MRNISTPQLEGIIKDTNQSTFLNVLRCRGICSKRGTWYVERLSTLLSFEWSGSGMADLGIGVDERLSGSCVRLVAALGGGKSRAPNKCACTNLRLSASLTRAAPAYVYRRTARPSCVRPSRGKLTALPACVRKARSLLRYCCCWQPLDAAAETPVAVPRAPPSLVCLDV